MPTYPHICENQECNFEWTDFYSIKQDPPKICPKCNQETAKRVIALSGKGIVELYGQDLVDKCREDAQRIKKEASKDANKYANLLGETKYHNLQTQLDRRGK